MKPLPMVTDHCVLRYLERACGYDIEAVRIRIATICADAVNAGASSLKAEGVTFQFSRSGTVITATPNGPMPARSKVTRYAEAVEPHG